ncbi:MAG TPA: hypothetical protein VMM36_15305 [Opitutaceae bacterium]|nr:hypothetical protein [Opitutaceae bacterium]
MSSDDNDPEFYVGYLPHTPTSLARFVRGRVVRLLLLTVVVAAGTAAALPYFGDGVFEFGVVKPQRGAVLCDVATRLSEAEAEYILVGPGKRGAPIELCSGGGGTVEITGTRLSRGGKEFLEVDSIVAGPSGGAPRIAATPLGRMTLAGEIVDAKCYFGVMNPGEGRVHRACATLCLRGGITAVFVVRDRQGNEAHLLLAPDDGTTTSQDFLQWVAEPVEITGEVFRQGQWLVFRINNGLIRGT